MAAVLYVRTRGADGGGETGGAGDGQPPRAHLSAPSDSVQEGAAALAVGGSARMTAEREVSLVTGADVAPSKPWATACIQVPTLERKAPTQNRR